MDFCGYGFMKLAEIPAYANSIPMAMAGMVARGLGLGGPLFEPFPIASGSNTEMSFFERVIDKVMPAYTVLLDGMDIRELSVSVVQKLVDPAFTAEEAIANGRYLFFNTEEHMDFPRPISHKVIYIGGITVAQSSADALPDDYKKIFDNAKHGVVYVSFGSIARSKFMPEHIKAAFLKTFKAFPEINFIWKYEDPSDDVAKDLPNVFKMAWVPQKEVLAHPRLLAFVTHGGMNSVLEAALTGVPLLGVPLFADQYRNVRMLEFRGTSVIIKKNDVTPKKLIAAIHTLTDTDDHRIRAREIASLARTKPLNATQRFISYINHAIAFSNTTDFLDINNRQMSTFKYFDLDVYAFLIGFAIFIVTVIVYALFKVVSLIRSAILRVVFVDQKKTL
uniref:UDP-glucuronosyltransferase n=1 Tax=Panagrellus redivivus TaxID=6233 RepID=A0A7E4VNA9_PANRE